MATETTKTDKKTDDTATTSAAETEDKKPTEDATPPKQRTDADERRAAVVADDDLEDDVVIDRPIVVAEKRSVWGAGAAAVVSAGLGLSALIGTPLSEMLRDRKQLMGQIESSAQGQSGGGGADQINSLYGAPWHATAVVNGFFALLAVIVGGALLGLVAKRAETASWVKALALGGLVLGVLGLIIAGGMYLDLFASAPKVPSAPAGQPAQ